MSRETNPEPGRNAIKKVGWVAEETSVSRMTPGDRRALLLPQPPVPPKVLGDKVPFPIPSLPPSFDWRNVNGRNYITSVKTQVGSTCVAFANTAALESLILRTSPLHRIGIDLSEHALVSLNSGYPSVIAEFLISVGLPPETCYPSDAASWDSSTPRKGWQDQTYRVVTHKYYKHLTVDEMTLTLH